VLPNLSGVSVIEMPSMPWPCSTLRGKVEVHQKDQPPQPPQPVVPAHAKEAVATASAQAKQQGQ